MLLCSSTIQCDQCSNSFRLNTRGQFFIYTLPLTFLLILSVVEFCVESLLFLVGIKIPDPLQTAIEIIVLTPMSIAIALLLLERFGIESANQG